VAFTDPDRSITYAELQSRTCRLARALQTLGVRPEERIAVLLPDMVDYPVAFWGAIRAGVVAVPLNPLLTAEQYAYILDDCRASLMIATAPLARIVLPVLDRLPNLRTIVLVAAALEDSALFAGVRVYDFEQILARESGDCFVAATSSDEVAFWLYTSGSTGAPKGVKHVHTSPMATARLMGQGVLGIREDDVVFSAAKLFFAYGLGNAMSFPMSVGASAVLWPQRATPDAVFKIMRRHRPTLFLQCQRSMQLCWRTTIYAAALVQTVCAFPFPQAKLCQRIWVNAGASWSEWMSSTVSDLPKCCRHS
jgi:4-hydroxybenzoate-CoA ligase